MVTLVLVKSHCFSVYTIWLLVLLDGLIRYFWSRQACFIRITMNRRDYFSFWQCNSTSGSEGFLLHFQFGCQFGGGSGVKSDPFWRVEEFAFEVSLLLRWAILAVCFCAFIKAQHSLEGRCVDGDGSIAFTSKTFTGGWIVGGRDQILLSFSMFY